MNTRELIFGSPGTGKTTAMLAILEEELARGVPPDRIAFVSFTRKAADEAITRAGTKFNLSRADLPWFRTLHSLCFRSLGLKPADVLEGKMMRDFSVFSGIEVTGRFAEDGSMQGYSLGDRILHMEHLARVRGMTLRQLYDEDDDNLPWSEVERVSRFLGAYKATRRMMDYTDMLSEFVAYGQGPKLEVLLVDECQDLSFLQWKVVEVLSKDVRRVVYAGDDDQAIYRWAGAQSEVLVDMDWPATILGQSYRVPRTVQDVAAKIIGRVSHRREKSWKPRDDDGEVARVENIGLAAIGDTSEEVLILARNTYVLAEQVVPELKSRGIYYAWGDRGAISADTVQAIMLWEKLRKGAEISYEDAKLVMSKIRPGHGYERPDRGHPTKFEQMNKDQPVSMADLKKHGGLLVDSIWHEALDGIARDDVTFILAARRRNETIIGKPRVRLSTIHGAKGGQAPHVVLMQEMAKRTFKEFERLPDDEARVWYVGATRAMNKLTIVNTNAPTFYDL